MTRENSPSHVGPAEDRDEIRPVNTASWMNATRGLLEVAQAPYPVPGGDQIVVRNYAVAVNPLDWITQVAGQLAYR